MSAPNRLWMIDNPCKSCPLWNLHRKKTIKGWTRTFSTSMSMEAAIQTYKAKLTSCSTPSPNKVAGWSRPWTFQMVLMPNNIRSLFQMATRRPSSIESSLTAITIITRERMPFLSVARKWCTLRTMLPANSRRKTEGSKLDRPWSKTSTLKRMSHLGSNGALMRQLSTVTAALRQIILSVLRWITIMPIRSADFLRNAFILQTKTLVK